MSKPVRFMFVNPIDHKSLVETAFPHLGLGHLSSAIKRAFPGSETIIVSSHLREWIRKWQPDIVGVTSVSQYWNEAKDQAREAKQLCVPVLVGGIHATSLPDTITEDMDAAVMTEGEETVVDLIRLFQLEGPVGSGGLSAIPGIAYWEGQGVVKTRPRPMIQDLDSLPFPDRTILPQNRHTGMFTSRGCPYRCTFCASTRYWPKMRFHSAEYVVSQIEQLYLTQHVSQITFLDDLFVADRKRLTVIIEGLEKRNLIGRISYICNVRSNLVDDELCMMLRDMNVKIVGIGMESACPTSLEYLKGRGNITVADHANAIVTLRRYGIDPHPSFIIGSPLESREDIMETYKFIREYQITNFEVYVLLPFPATPIWDYAKGRGLVDENMDWARLRWQITNFGKGSVVLSERLDYAELAELYNLFVRRREWPKIRDMLLQGFQHPLKAIRYTAQHLSPTRLETL